MNELSERIKKKFKSRFGNDFLLIQSPGRVNLIGEHTDYNDGFALPAAIDKRIVLAMGTNSLRKIRLFSVDMDEKYEISLGGLLQKSGLHWPDYIIGVVDQLRKNGYKTGGFDCVFGGDIPIGAGLSSSAALEGGVALGLSELFDLSLSKMEMTVLSQKAENDFVGMQCGIMDQFASIHGQQGHVLKLDCRSLEYEVYPFRRADIKIILCDTGVHRELTSSEYNIRRSECEEGVRILQQHHSEIKSLRDVELPFLEQYKEELPPVVYQRCKFVLQENQRVEDACEALVKDDFDLFGQKMYQSHVGLRDLYEVSCRELDLLVDIAETVEGVFGSRMMGGGFGGCTINLVQEESAEDFMNEVQKRYREKMGYEIEIYQASISDGTKRITEEVKS